MCREDLPALLEQRDKVQTSYGGGQILARPDQARRNNKPRS